MVRLRKNLNNRELRFIAQSFGMFIKTHQDFYTDDAYNIFEKFSALGFDDEDIEIMVEYFEHY